MSENATPEEWAKVELMGHRVRYGRVTEVERFGACLLRIDVLRNGDDAPVLTEYYSGAAIFAFTPCTEETARIWTDRSYGAFQARLSLPPPDDDAPDEDIDF